MDEKFLLKLSLAFSLLGILLILFISENTDLPISKISDITNKQIDTTIKIKGTIEHLTELENLILFSLKDKTGKINIILFTDETLNLKQNQKIELIGKVIEYKNTIEIMADQIKT